MRIPHPSEVSVADEAEVPVPSVPGPVEAKVRSDIASLMSGHPMGEALAEMAFTLARALDAGAGLATAAVSRELRACLVELSKLAVDADDDLEGALSTPVRDGEEPG